MCVFVSNSGQSFLKQRNCNIYVFTAGCGAGLAKLTGPAGTFGVTVDKNTKDAICAWKIQVDPSMVCNLKMPLRRR